MTVNRTPAPTAPAPAPAGHLAAAGTAQPAGAPWHRLHAAPPRHRGRPRRPARHRLPAAQRSRLPLGTTRSPPGPRHPRLADHPSGAPRAPRWSSAQQVKPGPGTRWASRALASSGQLRPCNLETMGQRLFPGLFIFPITVGTKVKGPISNKPTKVFSLVLNFWRWEARRLCS